MKIPSSETFLTMFDQIPGVVAFVSIGTLHYEFVNSAFERAFGLTREQIIGSHIKDIIGESNYQFALQYIDQVREGKTVSYENVFNLVSGKRWIEVNYSPMFDDQGRVTTIAVLSNDITSRKNTEEALAANEERFRQLADSTFEAIVIHDKGTLLDVNEAFCRMLGYDRSEVIGKTVMDLVAPESKELVVENIRTGYDKPYENAVVRKDGTVMVLETIGRDIQYEGRMVRVTAMRDLTERKEADRALRESRERLELAAQSAQLGIWDWDIIANKIHWDDQMFRLYGITERPASYSVEIWHTGVHPDDVPFAWEACQAALLGEKKYDIEFRVQHPDGSLRVIKADGTVFRDKNGTAVRMLGINRDITDQKRAEEEHQKYDQQLQQMQRLESLGNLAGGIAHDFNNLMGGIYGFIDLATSDPDRENIPVYLSKAVATIDRARALTRQLLTFAKGGAPVRKVGRLSPFIEETTRFALSGSNVKSRFTVQPGLWTSKFDRNQIGQVIDNIVINAQQAMPVGGTLEVTAQNIFFAEKEHPLIPKGKYIRIAIKDSGTGIPREHLSRIFDPYFTTKTMGHGLGLATCYSIVNRHNGCIDVESESGKGTTFTIYLPACAESVQDDSDKRINTHKGTGTFLIMEDERVIRESISSMLGLLGYTAVCKENGKDAVAHFEAEMKEHRSFAGIILDLTVPGGMGGEAAVAEIRKLNTDVPVFVASGYADDPVMQNPTGYGFTASISKPFTLNKLSELLNQYVTK
jgi:PAS domain S-box-containing protein